MEDILILLIGILVLIMLALIAWYNHLDRLRFRLDRLLKGAMPALDDWADACEALHPGAAEGYRKAKRNWEKTACLQAMVETVAENSAKKLDIQEQLLDFCYQFRCLAEKYNEKLESALFGKLARAMGFRPYAVLDFYPHIRPAKPEN